MLGLYVNVPIACFRKGLAREYLETEVLPSPAMCYGFLLSLVGEIDRERHLGTMITPMLLGSQEVCAVLRKVWRVKDRKEPLGSNQNSRPDYQQLIIGTELVIWCDSSQEANVKPTLESRVQTAIDPKKRKHIDRFGGLSIGESTHMVNEILSVDQYLKRNAVTEATAFLTDKQNGRLSLPVWVDHVGSKGTRYVIGNLQNHPINPPETACMAMILKQQE